MDDNGERRGSDQWIRDGFEKNNNKIDTVDSHVKQLDKSVKELDKLIRDSVPEGMTPKEHKESHEILDADTIKRKKREEGLQKFWSDMFLWASKAALTAIIMFAVGVVGLGIAAQFKQWVVAALIPVETKK